jgi:acyl carrier protein
MTHDEIRAELERALRKIAPDADPSTLDGHADIRDALDIDSMDFLGFVTRIHETFHVDVPERDYAKVRTLEDGIAYIAARLP